MKNPGRHRAYFASEADLAKARVFALDAIIHEAIRLQDSANLEGYLAHLSQEMFCKSPGKGRLQDFSDLVASYISLRKQDFLLNPAAVAKAIPCHDRILQTLLSGIMGGLTQPEFKSKRIEDFYVGAYQSRCQYFKPDSSKECP